MSWIFVGGEEVENASSADSQGEWASGAFSPNDH